jgi:hypothetical protein
MGMGSPGLEKCMPGTRSKAFSYVEDKRQHGEKSPFKFRRLDGPSPQINARL